MYIQCRKSWQNQGKTFEISEQASKLTKTAEGRLCKTSIVKQLATKLSLNQSQSFFLYAMSHFPEIADDQQILQLHFMNPSIPCAASQQSYRKMVREWPSQFSHNFKPKLICGQFISTQCRIYTPHISFPSNTCRQQPSPSLIRLQFILLKNPKQVFVAKLLPHKGQPARKTEPGRTRGKTVRS